jgi:molybdopterin-binding protein
VTAAITDEAVDDLGRQVGQAVKVPADVGRRRRESRPSAPAIQRLLVALDGDDALGQRRASAPLRVETGGGQDVTAAITDEAVDDLGRQVGQAVKR